MYFPADQLQVRETSPPNHCHLHQCLLSLFIFETERNAFPNLYILSNNDDMPPRLLALEVGLAQELRGQQGNLILHKFSTVVILSKKFIW